MATQPDQDALFDGEEEDVTSEQSEALSVPVGERRLVTQPYDLSLTTLVDDIRRQRLLLSIEYQRKYVWDRSKASRLIESFLLNIPVPVCYFAENEDGTYEVIDGLQRIQTVNDFLTGQFSLRGVSVVTEFEGLHFEDLPLKEQRRLGNRTIRCIVITDDSHPDIKFDVFERLNTGSAMLAAQELRNCIYRGSLNSFLKELANESYFSQILGGIKNNRMAYEELALRFFSLYEDLSSYKPPLRQLLNSYMRNHRKGRPTEDAVKVFEETCNAVHEIFGSEAFRIMRDGKLGAFNKALFDSIMIALSFSDRGAAISKADEVRTLREELLDRESFQTSIGRATADRTRMHGRIKAFATGLTRLGVRCELPDLPEL
ncbi:DUF262 domain-containing protein [Streptomyces sp. NPDC006540]|uniref:DUF262 domain-containing protein n=1 Tax=Streptomyces sp. NPDC006540 TaxID=3155353 RepID=UPI0033BF0E6D